MTHPVAGDEGSRVAAVGHGGPRRVIGVLAAVVAAADALAR